MGLPETYEDDSPEQLVIKYLIYWKAGNYGGMAKLRANLGRPLTSPHPKQIRGDHESLKVESFRLISIKDQGAALSRIILEIRGRQYDRDICESREFIVAMLDENGDSIPRNMGEEKWWITADYFYRG